MVIDTAKLDRGFYAVDQNGALYSVVIPSGGFNGISDTIELKPIHYSNGDRIRRMTDEELANFIENPGKSPWVKCDECKWESCIECCLEWLKQECEE